MDTSQGKRNTKSQRRTYTHAPQCLSIPSECGGAEGSITLTIVAVIIYHKQVCQLCRSCVSIGARLSV